MKTKSFSMAILAGFLVVLSSGVAMARTVKCISYSSLCAFDVQYEVAKDELAFVVVDHAKSKDCKLSPAQTIVLRSSQDQPPGGVRSFEGESSLNSRRVILRLDPNVWAQPVFEAVIDISLEFDPYTYVRNSILCREL